MTDGGFFDLGTGIPPPKKGDKKIKGCLGCGLFKTCNSPKMEVDGIGEKEILVIGETPGKNEDAEGSPFIGNSGQLLEREFEKLNINFRDDCWITNAVCCRPPNNRGPSDQEIAECRLRLLKNVEELKPKIIILLGTTAIKGLLQHRLSGRLTGIKPSAFFNKIIPDNFLNTWVCPMYHPSYLLRREDPVLNKIFREQLKKIIGRINTTQLKPHRDIFYTEDVKEAIDWVKEAIKTAPHVTFDYETTGIKPHREGHRIASASIAFCNSDTGEFKGYAFPFFNDPHFQEVWKKLLTGNVKKVAHKIDFEAIWTKEILGYWPENWMWDTCLAAHCLNSKQNTKLKYQVFVEFGDLGFDEEIDKYIKGKRPGEDEKSKNSFNNILEAPKKELLEYNAFDSLYSLQLFYRQGAQLDSFAQKGFDFLLEGVIALAEVHQEGINIDLERLDTYEKRTTKKINRHLEEIKSFSEYKKWKESKPINLDSDVQISKLLYKVLDYQVPEGCEDSKTSAKALEKIGTDFTLSLLPYRRLKKIRDTFMAQFKREQVKGIVRAFYNLHIASTFRSTCDSPNFQNQVKRGEGAELIRDLIIPRKGNRLIEYDYKGVEVCISACYHKDPQMIKYIEDPSSDMHKDMAIEIFMKRDIDKKTERHVIKNNFVFPAFYGSSTKPEEGKTIGNVTRNIWDNLKKETIDHLKSKGIKSIRKFQKHMEEVEWKFWNERFEVYNDWKTEMYEEYQKKGYVELFTGFRCYGPLKFTEATNYPIQGTAFHILLETLINSRRKIKEISNRSAIIGQIHDSLIVDAHPDDEEEIDNIIYHYGVRKTMKKYDWIIVPLNIEKERSEIDGSWANMEECGYLK